VIATHEKSNSHLLAAEPLLIVGRKTMPAANFLGLHAFAMANAIR